MIDPQDLKRLVVLVHNLRTQDNACTAWPLFIVQQRRRLYGFDTDYSENIIWIYEDDADEVDENLQITLEAGYDATGEVPDGYTRTAYQDTWEFVTACLTRDGCEDYLKANGHNLCEPRIYVDSGHRNAEWQWLRAFLPKLMDDVVVAKKSATIPAECIGCPENDASDGVWCRLHRSDGRIAARCPRAR